MEDVTRCELVSLLAELELNHYCTALCGLL